MKLTRLFMVFVFIFIFLGLVSASYVISDPKYTEKISHSSLGTSTSGFFDTNACEQGQDFVVQIAPAGCTPAVVRSDLLEEQDVPVFCQLQAMKINPFINIEAIDSIRFEGSYAPGVRTIGFTPSYSALGANRQLNSLMWNNIGYATIVLSRGAIDSGVLECEDSALGGDVCWVQGNLSAKISYDVEGGFGIRTHTFYLPIVDDKEFSRSYGKYEFFDGRGYLRANDIQSDSATVGIYSARLQNPFSEGSFDKQQYRQFNLEVGEESQKLLLPGAGCFAGVKFKLNDVENSDVRARISINSRTYEMSVDEEFLSGDCRLSEINHVGMNQDVRVVCKTEDGIEAFDLHVTPSVMFSIDGESVEAEVGQRLYEAEDGTSVYFAYADSEDDIIENTRVMLVKMPKTSDRLTNSEVEKFATLARMSDADPEGFLENANSFMGVFSGVGQYIIDGTSNLFLDYNGTLVNSAGISSDDAWGTEVSISSFGVSQNGQLNSTIQREYNLAVEDYDEVYSTYSVEKYPETSNLTLGAKALSAKINLAFSLSQNSDVDTWCDDAEERFSNSLADFDVCSNFKKLANTEISTRDVVIDGEVKRISFEGVVYPKFDEYGAEVLVRMPNGQKTLIPMEKNRIYSLNEETNEFIRLVELAEDRALIEFNIQNKSFMQNTNEFLSSNKFRLEVDTTRSIGSYAFTLSDVNLEKVAKVTVKPDIAYDQSDATFPFKIGVEQRAIQLTPEKALDLADKLNDTIDRLESISSSMDSVVKGMKTACLATGAILTAKNLLFGAGGETIARQKVMQGEGGWNEWCRIEIAKENSPYNSLDDCFMKNSDAIDEDVEKFVEVMNEQNQYIEETQEVENNGLLGGKVADRDQFAQDFAQRVDGYLNEDANITKDGESIDIESVKLALQDGWEQGLYSIDELKQVDLYARLLEQDPNNEIYEDRFFTALKQIELNSERYTSVISAENNLESVGVQGLDYKILIKEEDDRVEEVYEGYVNSDSRIGDIPVNSFVQGVSVYGEEYLVTLKNIGGNEFTIDEVYDEMGNDNVDNETVRRVRDSYSVFKRYDKSSYQNEIINPEIKYYENEPYKGLPSLVPFDKKEGWYAYMKQTVPVGSNVAVYDESARVSSFYLCNVGNNGLVDFEKSSSDDVCQLIKTQSGVYNQFAGLSQSETRNLVEEAVDAVYEASRSYRDGVRNVDILGESYEVGSPAVDDSGLSCVDYMSPKDCKLMFNVCDPVICPNDRCDFGGDYPVSDVIQSGIIGSLALCLPNIQEGIYVPVCLSGVKAGLDGLTSVTTAYRDCLETNAKTGETVGICDEIHSVYLCEFFWKQGIPLAKIAIPKLMSVIAGEDVRGGSSYSNVESAWANAQDSVNFFTEYYAVNSFKAFKARSQEQVGTEVCKSFVSVAYPSGQGFFDALTEGDSPAQFNANFDEIKLTTATSPPTSHYKVYYHIYSGNDRGAYFNVYIRGASSSSYFQDTGAGRTIASGYIPVGDYASETIDFTAPSGYKELCVRVNDQEECGFGEVTTSFAKNYLKDQYLENQVSNTDITTEAECISGSPNVYSLSNLNVQEGVSDAINPELYNEGIIRTCATDNPGIGTDPYVGTKDSRWQAVGSCGEASMKCWLDTETIDDAMNFEISSEQALEEVAKNYLDAHASENEFLTEEEFDVYVERNLTSESNLRTRIVKISNALDLVFLNNHKGYLYFLRGEAYGEIAERIYSDYIKQREEEVSDDEVDADWALLRLSEFEEEYENLDKDDEELFLDFMRRYERFLNRLRRLGIFDYNSQEYYFNEDVKIFGKGVPIFDALRDAIIAKRDSVDVQDVSLEVSTSYLFEYEDGRAVSNLCYMYFDSIWHWSPVCEEISGGTYTTGAGPSVTISGESIEWHPPTELETNIGERPTAENRRFITNLRDKSYSQGIELFLERLSEDEGGTFANPSFVVKDSGVEVDGDNILTLPRSDDGELYFVYRNGEWYYSMISYDLGDSGWKIVGDYDVQKQKRIGDYVADSLKWFNEAITFGMFDSDVENVVTYKLTDLEKDFVSQLEGMSRINGYVYLLGSVSQPSISSGGQDVSDENVENLGGFNMDELLLQYPKTGVLSNYVDFYLGKSVNETEACSIDNQGAVNCYTGLMVVYEAADVGINCVYSASDGERFSVFGESISVGSAGPKDSNGNPIYVTNPKSSCGNVGIGENEKLNLLMPFSQMDLIVPLNDGVSPHSIMFLNWADRENNIARVFDTGYLAGNYRTYSVSEIDLSNDAHPVYKIRYPTFYEKPPQVEVEEPEEREEETSEEPMSDRELLIKSFQRDGKIEEELTDNDMEVLLSAELCQDCGDAGLCDDYECEAIRWLTGRICVYDKHWTGIGGSCDEEIEEGVEYTFSDALGDLSSGMSKNNVVDKMLSSGLISQSDSETFREEFSEEEFRQYLHQVIDA